MSTIFITGASAGLGKAAALLFQAKGWQVIATMRNPAKETQLTQLNNVTVLPLDVTNEQQVQEAVQAALALGNVDVVFNNAGYGLVGPMENYTEAQIDQQFDTNVLGVFRVARAFIPYFKQRRAGMFITTTSICGVASTPLSAVYCAAKWALEGWSEAMYYDLAQFNIGIKTVAPGGIKSSFVGGMQAVSNAGYETLHARMMEGFNDGTLISFTDPEAIAAVVYEAATDGKDQLRYLAGADAVKAAGQKETLGDEQYRRDMAQYLGLQSPYATVVA